MASAVDAPGGGGRLQGREEESRPTLDELLAADHWRRDVRDPELKKALGYVRATIGEIRRLLALPADERPLWTPEIKARLRDTLDQPVARLNIDSAWELYNALKAMLLYLGNPDYVAALLEYEAERDKDASRFYPWTTLFSAEELQDLRVAFHSGTADRRVQQQAADKLALLYRSRAAAAQLRRARLRQRTRYLTLATVFIVALFLVSVAVIGVQPALRDPALLIALLIGFIAGVAIEVTRIRERVTDIDQLRLVAPATWLAIATSAAFCTGFVIAHVAAGDLSEHSKSTELLLVGIAALTATVLAVAWSGFWRRWIFWRQEDKQDADVSLLASAVAVAALIEFFAISTVVLAVYGAVDVPGKRTPELASVEQYYAWHLADAIPALDVPETLNWERPLTSTDHFGGLLLLAFKLLAILPIAGLIAGLIERYRTGREGNAASSSSP
jgi:hypothetical protein